MNIQIRKVEKEELLGDLYQAYKEFAIRDYADMFPDQSQLTDDEIGLELEDNVYDESRYFAFLDGQIIGSSEINRPSESNPAYEQNKNRIGFRVSVLPEFRRQHLGTKLAIKALEDPLRHDDDNMRVKAYSSDGRGFVETLDGKVVSKSSTRELLIKDVDWKLVQSWKNISFTPDKKPIVEFHKRIDWDIAEQLLDLSLEISNELSQMDNRDFVHTREVEEYDWHVMLENWQKIRLGHDCFILKDQNGKVIGYTACSFHPDNPDMTWQGMTAVWKHHRGNGYGKFLKALMLDSIRTNHPQIEKINTSNNDLNDSMVSINRKLGFVEKSYWCSYVVDCNQAMGILRSKNGC